MSPEFLLTAYHIGCGCRGPLTRTETKPLPMRTVAVDPKVIPLGSLIEIEGYGLRVAEDTGRDIKGQWIDIYASSCEDAWQHGVKKAKVTILIIPEKRKR